MTRFRKSTMLSLTSSYISPDIRFTPPRRARRRILDSLKFCELKVVYERGVGSILHTYHSVCYSLKGRVYIAYSTPPTLSMPLCRNRRRSLTVPRLLLCTAKLRSSSTSRCGNSCTPVASGKRPQCFSSRVVSIFSWFIPGTSSFRMTICVIHSEFSPLSHQLTINGNAGSTSLDQHILFNFLFRELIFRIFFFLPG